MRYYFRLFELNIAFFFLFLFVISVHKVKLYAAKVDSTRKLPPTQKLDLFKNDAYCKLFRITQCTKYNILSEFEKSTSKIRKNKLTPLKAYELEMTNYFKMAFIKGKTPHIALQEWNQNALTDPKVKNLKKNTLNHLSVSSKNHVSSKNPTPISSKKKTK